MMSRAARRAQPYHHGDLAHALVAAAEDLLAERGVEGFTLRECARRAGVSHAAPAHHFGDVNGLLTAVAAAGFARLTRAMREAAEREQDQDAALVGIGVAYVRFAFDHPALFRLMFHSDRLDRGDENLRAAGSAASDVLKERLAAVRRIKSALHPPEARFDPTRMRAWAVVHGIATLAIEGRLGPRGNDHDRFLLTTVRAALRMQVEAYRREAAQARRKRAPSARTRAGAQATSRARV